MARGRTQFPKKSKAWSGLGSAANAFGSSATALILSVAQGTAPSTILRILGNWFVQPTPGGTIAALDAAEVCLAVGVVSTDAAAVGSTAMPDPITEEGYPWLYWKSFFYQASDAAIPEVGSTPGGGHFFDVDVKSMRRVMPNQSVVVIAQYLDNSGTPPLTVHWSGARILSTLT